MGLLQAQSLDLDCLPLHCILVWPDRIEERRARKGASHCEVDQVVGFGQVKRNGGRQV